MVRIMLAEHNDITVSKFPDISTLNSKKIVYSLGPLSVEHASNSYPWGLGTTFEGFKELFTQKK